jgi:hypothetical protein
MHAVTGPNANTQPLKIHIAPRRSLVLPDECTRVMMAQTQNRLQRFVTTRRGASAAMDEHHVTGPNQKENLQNSCDRRSARMLTMDKCTADWPKRKKTEAPFLHPGAAQMLPWMNAPRDWPKPKQDHRNSSARRSAGSVGWITA